MKIKGYLEKFIEDIEKDSRDYATNIAKIMAKDIADEMAETARSAIQIFYNQYDPEDVTTHNGNINYYRHWNFEKKSYQRFYRNHDPRFYGGIKLLMEEFPNVYTGTNSSPQSVFWRVYSGYHGIASFMSAKGKTSINVPIMTPAPIEIINKKFQFIQNNLTVYERKAAKEARKKKYKYIF